MQDGAGDPKGQIGARLEAGVEVTLRFYSRGRPEGERAKISPGVFGLDSRMSASLRVIINFYWGRIELYCRYNVIVSSLLAGCHWLRQGDLCGALLDFPQRPASGTFQLLHPGKRP